MVNYLTQQKLNELKAELEEYKTDRRIQVADRLKRSKELGDLSENSEYIEAREEQQGVERHIQELEDTIRNAEVITMTSGTKTVRLGATVRIKKNGQILNLTIVGRDEVDPDKGYISNESPLGQALLGKKVSDSVKIETPNGLASFLIEAIE